MFKFLLQNMFIVTEASKNVYKLCIDTGIKVMYWYYHSENLPVL